MNHDEYREALALDALGALDESERRALDEHVRACAECLRERAEFGDVASALAYAAPPVSPPAHVRAQLLERVHEMNAARPTAPLSEVQAMRAEAASETGRVIVPSPDRFTRARPSLFTRAVAYGALAASVLFAVGLFFVYGENQTLRRELSRLGAESNSTREELARQGEELARRQEEIAREREVSEVLAAPTAAMVALAGKESAPRARASLIYDRATGRAILMASGLPPAPDGKEYQLWFIAGTRPPMPGRSFKTDGTGRALMRDEIPAEGRDAKTFAVTLEPAGGLPAPTGSIYLVGSAS